MFAEVHKGSLFRPFLLALCLHILFLIFFPKHSENFENQLQNLKPVEISTLTRSDLERFRTVGVNGGKKYFSTPIPVKKISSSGSPGEKQTGKTNSLNNGDFSLTRGIGRPTIQYSAQKVTKDLFPGMAGSGLAASSLNIGFEPPEGVSETELNSTEKIYYGFSKRNYEIYISSLISSFNKLMREKPYLDLSKISETQNLTGRIVFNQEGRAVDTQFFLQSKNEHIQQLFENTLMDIRYIPNPPKGLLNRDGTFAIHYKLQVESN